MSTELLPLAQQTMPTFDGAYWLLLASRVLHILGVIILLGGVFYLRTVVMPSPAAVGATNVDQKFGGLRAKWAMWIGIATLLLIVTGFLNFFNIIRAYDVASSYHMIFGLKFLAAFAFFFLAALIAGRSVAAETIRQKMRFWIGVCLALGILTVALGSVLRTYPRNPKIDAPVQPTLVAPANQDPAE